MKMTCRLLLSLGVLAILQASVAAVELPAGTRVLKGIDYRKIGGKTLELDLYLPPQPKSARPVIVWIHGGAWRAGSKDGPSPALKLLEDGYAVAQIQYRLSQEAVWPAQIEDCKSAVMFLRSKAQTYGLDTRRFAAWGSSAGGHLAAMLGAETAKALSEDPAAASEPDWAGVQAVVDWFGPIDFLQMDKAGSSMVHDAPDSPESSLIGGPIQQHPERSAAANPITYLAHRTPGTTPPFLIMHGTEDKVVPTHQSELLRDALKGEEATYIAVRGAGHGFPGDNAVRTVRGFLAKTLLDPGRRLRSQPWVPYGLFSKPNLAAWCIVPFDAGKRSPEDRASMLEKLGLRWLAYDYRAEHVPTFDRELEACRKHGITLLAWWFPGEMNAEARGILEVLKRHKVSAQLWVTGGGAPAKNEEEQRAKVEGEARRLEPIARAAAEAGCTVGLYNHGGWFGEPENQIAIIDQLATQGVANVGIVYNQHHGHEHLNRFETLLARIKPHLLALNLNGMENQGDRQGKKILPIGQGARDVEMLGIIERSGWRGPVGILNHTDEDAEARLRDNLEGLEWVVREAQGHRAPRPTPRSWKAAKE